MKLSFKHLLAAVLTVCLLLGCAVSAMAASPPGAEIQPKPLLSEMDKAQCLDILSDLGVTIPAELHDVDIQGLVKDLERNPNMPAPILNYTPMAELFEGVRTAVEEYQGSAPSATQYTLQNSTVYSWNASTMGSYNCYAYAIGRTFSCQPGDFSGQAYDHTASITSVAAMIKEDLKGNLKYNCVKIQSSRPSSASGWTNAIAVRKDTTGDLYGFNDYHFAKLSSGNWYHKPGLTAVLKFNTAPSNSFIWTNEAFDGEYWPPTISYESNIMYLLYKPTHGNTTYTWTGQHYHSGTEHFYQYGYLCSDCSEYTNTVWTSAPCSGPPCATPWSLTPTPEVS